MFEHFTMSMFFANQNIFVAAAFIGFAAAVPLGPISILSLQRAMAYGFFRAFLPTMGAVIADGIFGVIAALGANLISATIFQEKFWLRLVGSVLLVGLGGALLSARHRDRAPHQGSSDHLRLAFLNFTLVLTNPLTLAFFLAAFTALGMNGAGAFHKGALIAGAGVSFGTLVWFALVCGLASLFRRRINNSLVRIMRVGMGGLFILVGLTTATFLVILG